MLGRWKTTAATRYSCRTCGLELEHRQSRIERIAWFVNAASLLALLGGQFLRESSVAQVPEELLFLATGLAVISFVAGALIWVRATHFVARDA